METISLCSLGAMQYSTGDYVHTFHCTYKQYGILCEFCEKQKFVAAVALLIHSNPMRVYSLLLRMNVCSADPGHVNRRPFYMYRLVRPARGLDGALAGGTNVEDDMQSACSRA